MTEPDVAVVPSANDVVLVGRSIFVLDMSTLVYVRGAMMAAPAMVTASAMMTPAVLASAAVSPSMASAMPFRVRCSHDSKSERRSDSKNERKPLEHLFSYRPGGNYVAALSQ